MSFSRMNYHTDIRLRNRRDFPVRNGLGRAMRAGLARRVTIPAKEILGLWIEQNVGAKFWSRVTSELKNRSLEGFAR